MEKTSPGRTQPDNRKTDLTLIKGIIESQRFTYESGGKAKQGTLDLTAQYEKNRKLNGIIETKSRFVSMALHEYPYPLKTRTRPVEILMKRLGMHAIKQSLLNKIKAILN